MTTDLSTPNEAVLGNQRKPFRPSREGVVVTGSLFSGGTLGWALSLVADQLPPPWKDVVTKLIPLATSAISGLVYLTSRLVKGYWAPKRFEADRGAFIRYCDDRLSKLQRARADLPKGPSAKGPKLKQLIQAAIETTEYRKTLAEVAEYPDRLWEQVPEPALVAKRKAETAEQ